MTRWAKTCSIPYVVYAFALCDINNTAAENERLKQQVKDLTDSLSNSNANIEKLTEQLVMKDGVSSKNTEEIPSTQT